MVVFELKTGTQLYIVILTNNLTRFTKKPLSLESWRSFDFLNVCFGRKLDTYLIWLCTTNAKLEHYNNFENDN